MYKGTWVFINFIDAFVFKAIYQYQMDYQTMLHNRISFCRSS